MEDEKEMLEEESNNEEYTEDAESSENVASEPENEEGAGAPAAEEETEDADEDVFEYDENGDLIIPEGIDAGSTSNEDTAEEENPAAEPDPRDAELISLREELEALRSQSKDTLKKLGVDTEDVMDGLAQVAAESADIPKDEYKQQREEARKAEIAAEAKRISDFETLAAKDLAELKEIYPETKAYKHVRDMPDEVLKKFAHNRNLGLGAKEAYAAANIDGIRSGAAATGKRQAMNESKAHLQASSPKSAGQNTVRIPAKDMEMWRGMFPNKSVKELAALYKKTL